MKVSKMGNGKFCVCDPSGKPMSKMYDTEAEAQAQMKTMMKESLRLPLATTDSLQESGYDPSKGELTITIIKPGFNKSKSRYYPASTLKNDHAIFEGAKMFADHATDTEAKTRPEGSVHNWVGNVTRTWAEGDGTVRGTAVVVDPVFKAKLDKLKETDLLKEMGVSIRAIGRGRKTDVEGTETNYIEGFVAARSVDFVTFAGAGGMVEAMESDEQQNELDVDLVTEAQLRQRRPDLVVLIESQAKEQMMKTVEEQLAEAVTENTELKTRITEAENKVKRTEAASELVKLLSESRLLDVSKDRIRKQFADAVTADGMKEAIVAEEQYVKQVSMPTPKKLGAVDNAAQDSDKKDEPNLEESFKLLGFDERQAKLAANR
jgi:hypothetical protein